MCRPSPLPKPPMTLRLLHFDVLNQDLEGNDDPDNVDLLQGILDGFHIVDATVLQSNLSSKLSKLVCIYVYMFVSADANETNEMHFTVNISVMACHNYDIVAYIEDLYIHAPPLMKVNLVVLGVCNQLEQSRRACYSHNFFCVAIDSLSFSLELPSHKLAEFQVFATAVHSQ